MPSIFTWVLRIELRPSCFFYWLHSPSSPSRISGILIDGEQESGFPSRQKWISQIWSNQARHFQLDLSTDQSSHGLSMSLGQLSLPYLTGENCHCAGIGMLFVMSEGGGPSVEDVLGTVFLIAFPMRKMPWLHLRKGRNWTLRRPRSMCQLVICMPCGVCPSLRIICMCVSGEGPHPKMGSGATLKDCVRLF